MLERVLEIWISLVFLGLALITVFVWVPFDSETPPIYVFRRQSYIGDAMLPMVSAGGIAVCAVIHLFLSSRSSKKAAGDAPFDRTSLHFFAPFTAIVAVSLGLMFWGGTVALGLVDLFVDEVGTYRQMRSTAPWKYIGYMLGGFTLVYGTISLIEGQLTFKRAVQVSLVVTGFMLVFDVPFDSILLPPNGDF